MARYLYLGEPPRPGLVVSYGDTTAISYNTKGSGRVVLTPVPPAVAFLIGEDLGYDITDATAISEMDVDSRFQRVQE